MNLRETIQLVQETAVTAAQVRPKFENIPGVPDDVIPFTVPGLPGFGMQVKPTGPRAYKAESLEGLCQQVSHFAPKAPDAAGSSADAAAGEARTLAVFAGEGAVKALLSEAGDRRDTIEMELKHSDGFTLLLNAGTMLKDLEQRDFEWILRTNFDGELQPVNFISQVKSLKFSRSENREGTIGTGRESLGASVMAEVMGLNADFPDEITVRVPVYSNVRNPDGDEFKIDVRCAVRLNLLNGKFTLRPLSGEMEFAQHAADSHVAERIRKAVPETVVVFECSAAG